MNQNTLLIHILIKELNQFWKGIKISILTENGVEGKTIREQLYVSRVIYLPAGHKNFEST